MRPTPSIKTLREVFEERATEAKCVLRMTRDELEQTPAGMARVRECYYPPTTTDVRMHVLAKLAGYGLEAFRTRHGYCEYLNMGDPYVATLLHYRGRYRVACWGDIAERDSRG